MPSPSLAPLAASRSVDNEGRRELRMVEYGDGGARPFWPKSSGFRRPLLHDKRLSRVDHCPASSLKEPAIRDRRMLNSRKGLEASTRLEPEPT